MMSDADRRFLARVATANQALGQVALPLIDGSITPERLRELGDELVAIGTELRRRGTATLDHVIIDAGPQDTA